MKKLENVFKKASKNNQASKRPHGVFSHDYVKDLEQKVERGVDKVVKEYAGTFKILEDYDKS